MTAAPDVVDGADGEGAGLLVLPEGGEMSMSDKDSWKLLKRRRKTRDQRPITDIKLTLGNPYGPDVRTGIGEDYELIPMDMKTRCRPKSSRLLYVWVSRTGPTPIVDVELLLEGEQYTDSLARGGAESDGYHLEPPLGFKLNDRAPRIWVAFRRARKADMDSAAAFAKVGGPGGSAIYDLTLTFCEKYAENRIFRIGKCKRPLPLDQWFTGGKDLNYGSSCDFLVQLWARRRPQLDVKAQAQVSTGGGPYPPL